MRKTSGFIHIAHKFARWRACVPMYLRVSVVYVPTCQERVNFSFLPANVLSSLLIFQIGVPTCQKACQFFKHSSDEILREISILYCYIEKFYIIPDTIVIHKNYLVLHFYTSCYIKEKCVEFFFFIFFLFFAL